MSGIEVRPFRPANEEAAWIVARVTRLDRATRGRRPGNQTGGGGLPVDQGVTVTSENMPALKWPGMLQTKRYVPG